MELLKNHGRTIVQEATQASEIEKIKSEHGHMPFEGDGLILNWNRSSDAITWTEIRPIYRLNRKDELKLLGGIKYYVDKYMEIEPMWGSAHYHFRGFMTPSGYRKASEEYKRKQEEAGKEQTSASSKVQRPNLKKALNMTVKIKALDDASAEERKERETAIEKALEVGKKRSEINVQDLRDKEGRARGKKLYEMLKAQQTEK